MLYFCHLNEKISGSSLKLGDNVPKEAIVHPEVVAEETEFYDGNFLIWDQGSIKGAKILGVSVAGPNGHWQFHQALMAAEDRRKIQCQIKVSHYGHGPGETWHKVWVPELI